MLITTSSLYFCGVISFLYSVIGTSSVRRVAQLKRKYPHLQFQDIVSLQYYISVVSLKGHWTTSASSPDFFQKSWDFHTIRSVYLCSDCMPNLTCNFNLITKICEFFFQRQMAATVMTVEFGTIHHYSRLEENSEACLCSSLNRYNKLTKHYVNYDILV